MRNKSLGGRKHDAFPDASSSTLATLDKNDFSEWLELHKKNLMVSAPVAEDIDNDDLD